MLSGNQARDGAGVAIDNDGLILNCVVYCNLAGDDLTQGWGGGVRLFSGGTVRGCLIWHNESTMYGGGVNIYEAGRVESCTIVSNTAPVGAGIRTRNLGSVVNSIIYGNCGADWALDGSGYSYNNCCSSKSGN